MRGKVKPDVTTPRIIVPRVSGSDVGRHPICVYAIAGLAGIATSARAISGQP